MSYFHAASLGEFMKRIRCRVCREWFEKNESGICSQDCVERARPAPVVISYRPLDQRWNHKLREEREKKKNLWKKPKPLSQKPDPSRPARHPKVRLPGGKGSKRKLKARIHQLEQEVKRLREVSGKAIPTFYDSREWKELRYKAIRLHGRTCMACGAAAGTVHVDHIKPRSKFPELALDLSNLQILCADCNIGKSNKDSTDWRPR